MAHVLAKDLRDAVLQAAIQGKLTKHYDTDTNVNETLKQVSKEKKRLIMSKKIGKEKPFSKARKFSETPFDIPHTWEWVRFGNLMVNKDSYRIPISKAERAKKEKIFDYYGASGVIDKIDNYLFDEPNLLIGEDGANLLSRSTPIAFIATGKYWVNNHAHVLNTCAHVNLEYIQLYINAIDLSPYVSGTAQPKMNQENMNAIWVALPPIEEQQRIVDRVDELMAKIDEYEKLENQLVQLKEQFPKDMRDSLLQAGMMGKLTEHLESDTPVNIPVVANNTDAYFGEIPDTWKYVHLGNVFNIRSASRVHKADWRNRGVPFYRAREVVKLAQNGSVENELYIDEELYEKFAKSSGVPKVGDLLVSGVGTLGATYIVKETDRFYYKDASVLCFENINNQNSNFAKYLLNTPYMIKQIYDQSAFGTTVATLTMKRANVFVVALPPLEEQQRIVDKLDELLPLVDSLAQMD